MTLTVAMLFIGLMLGFVLGAIFIAWIALSFCECPTVRIRKSKKDADSQPKENH